MKKNPEFKSWSAKQAVAILAVDNIKVSDFGLEVLKQVEDGLISYEEAKEKILSKAKEKAISSKNHMNLTTDKPIKRFI
ncbi:antitoxin VbhA family protein [Achromobacter insolitus]|uniref:antitoxin VbhA family protein n=1 Tax=Achromobacter insolitus TaxID=217204 RepID=UPI0020A5087E|nr:antitoxin VbhA family protein [Achromobacter insolitus]MCP1401839.1 hypothetical protein [Achromobacter insolitus]